MIFTLPQFSAALPEIILLAALSFIILLDVFLPTRLKQLTFYFVQLSLAVSFAMVAWQYKYFDVAIITFNGHYIVDKLALLTKLLVLLSSLFAFIYAQSYIRARQIARSEYYILGLIAVLGMLIMASAYTFLTIFLGLEMMSLALYAMIALHKESNMAQEAAMKFFVIGSLALGLLLYGMSMVYGATGSIEIDSIGKILGPGALSQHKLAVLGLIFMLAGLLFKFGAVPFHMWVPDVYQGAPTSVTLFIASAPKIAAFCITMRILVSALSTLSVDWQAALTLVAVLSMFGGNMLAIAQSNIKRMLAYSSIAHVGYSLLGVIAGPHASDGYSAAMFYIVTYVIMAAGAFAVIDYVSKDGVELDQLEDYRGLNARNPWLAFMMLLLMFSMAGIPPTVGFFAKLGLLEALVQVHMVWLAVLALIFAIIGAYYYLKIVMLMYFEEPRANLRDTPISLNVGVMAAISVNGIAALVLGLLPSTLIDMCRISFL